MKNVKYLGFIGLGCAALLLTGCGGESSNSNTGNGSETGSGSSSDIIPIKKNIFTCTKSMGSESETIEFEFNDKEDKVVGAKIYFTSKIPDDTTDDEIEDTMSEIKAYTCGDDDRYKSCDVLHKGNMIEVNATVDSSVFEKEDGYFYYESKEDIMIDLEGFTCK